MRGNLSVETLISRNFIQTNSVVYRRLERYDDIPVDVMPMDWYLHVRHAVRGDIVMLPDTMAVYRRHSEGMWHNRDADPAQFWLTRGPGHAALFDAMLDLVSGDPLREEIVARMADWILREMAKVPGPEGRAALLDTIARHPRSAMLALQHRWATPRAAAQDHAAHVRRRCPESDGGSWIFPPPDSDAPAGKGRESRVARAIRQTAPASGLCAMYSTEPGAMACRVKVSSPKVLESRAETSNPLWRIREQRVD